MKITKDKTYKFSFIFKGEKYIARTAREALIMIFQLFHEEDKTFLPRFSSTKHGVKRRYIAQNKYDLYPDRPDLADTASIEVVEGWWLGTNYSQRDMRKIIELAKKVIGPELSEEIKINFTNNN